MLEEKANISRSSINFDKKDLEKQNFSLLKSQQRSIDEEAFKQEEDDFIFDKVVRKNKNQNNLLKSSGNPIPKD